MALGAQVLSLHYDGVQKEAGGVPASILVGDVSIGKTRVALGMMGVSEANFVNETSDSKSAQITDETLGLVIDDADNLELLTKKLL